jgi:thiol-disulfide isomerase/thioredoxin
MGKILTYKKRWINIILSLTGIAIALLHSICKESCAYLEGSFLGLTLNYLGIFYMGALILSNLLKKWEVFLFLLSFGMGAELRLLEFQINNSVYCYYCLSFGAIILLLFFLNFERSKKIFITVSIVLGLILFAVFFKGSTTPVYAEEILLPSFGNGQIKVRLYTDYFCNPCRALEPKLEPVIIDLVKKGIINITFIDTPVHAQTTLYAKYFLYILNEDKDFNHALRARAVLFELAKEKITDYETLEAFLKKEGVKFRSFDTNPTFGVFSSYLKEDLINATPTCVIINQGKKDRFTGLDIIEAIKRLR